MMTIVLNIFAQEMTPQEKDFQSKRLETFQAAGDMAQLPTIWEMGAGIDDRGTTFL